MGVLCNSRKRTIDQMMMMSYEEWAKMLANVNCLVSVFCLRAVNAVVLRVDSYCLTKQSEMDEAM